MEQAQFISHAQVTQPSLVPRRGLGIFSALALVFAVLAGAVTGGLVLIEKSTLATLEAERTDLKKIRQDIEFESIKQAQSLQQRIDIARGLLGQHQYTARAFDFAENYTLLPIRLKSFSYNLGVVKMDATAPGFVVFAQQIKYYRSLGESVIKSFTFQNPTLNEKGEVNFVVEITLSPKYLATIAEPTVQEGGENQ